MTVRVCVATSVWEARPPSVNNGSSQSSKSACVWTLDATLGSEGQDGHPALASQAAAAPACHLLKSFQSIYFPNGSIHFQMERYSFFFSKEVLNGDILLSKLSVSVLGVGA